MFRERKLAYEGGRWGPEHTWRDHSLQSDVFPLWIDYALAAQATRPGHGEGS
jgi:hypothetical protein